MNAFPFPLRWGLVPLFLITVWVVVDRAGNRGTGLANACVGITRRDQALILLAANHHNSVMKAVEDKLLVTKLFHTMS